MRMDAGSIEPLVVGGKHGFMAGARVREKEGDADKKADMEMVMPAPQYDAAAFEEPLVGTVVSVCGGPPMTTVPLDDSASAFTAAVKAPMRGPTPPVGTAVNGDAAEGKYPTGSAGDAAEAVIAATLPNTCSNDTAVAGENVTALLAPPFATNSRDVTPDMAMVARFTELLPEVRFASVDATMPRVPASRPWAATLPPPFAVVWATRAESDVAILVVSAKLMGVKREEPEASAAAAALEMAAWSATAERSADSKEGGVGKKAASAADANERV